MQESYDSGILSMNHRSSASMVLVEETVNLLKQKLLIPSEYTIFFVSSATECWEIIVQSLIRNGSLHFYNGEFGKKWGEYTAKNIVTNKKNSNKDKEDDNDGEIAEKSVICLTHNETSNGTYLSNETMAFIRKQYKNALIVVDATSSMGGLALEWEMADIWFASVQKCFGLPAGLAIMVCSPQAIEQSLRINDRQYYNSMILLHENMLKFQTTHTPNILNIFLLSKVMKMLDSITIIDQKIRKRSQEMYDFLLANRFELLPIEPILCINLSKKLPMNREITDIDKKTTSFANDFYEKFSTLSKNELKSNFSPTVLTITATEKVIAKLKTNAQNNGILLGNGYGKWKNTTIRIANFPAITDHEFELLKENLVLGLV
jgi:phosphoserine aminotransferase